MLSRFSNTKVIVVIFTLIVCLGRLIYMIIKAEEERKLFYKIEINEKVVSCDMSPRRSTNFYLRSGTRLNFNNPTDAKIRIGDSVHKDSKTYVFGVYEKTVDSTYKLLRYYDFNRLN